MKIIESLEREGGHIAVLLLLFLYCMAVLSWDPTNSLAAKAGDMTLGALLLAMKGGAKPLEDSKITSADIAVKQVQETNKPS